MDHSDFDLTIEHGESALHQLKANRIPAYPSNFEFWYTYASGYNRELNQSVNDILKKFGRISINEVHELFDEHLSPLKLGDQVEAVGGKVSDEIAEAAKLISEALESSEEYGDHLTDASDRLSDNMTSADIGTLVRSLVSATTAMKEENCGLESKLRATITQIEDLRANIESIRRESQMDELTGIANRKAFDQFLAMATDTANLEMSPLALLLCDIDHFKAFNDKFGHQTGDQVLRLVGSTMSDNVKGRDLSARYGGEEFAVVLPDTVLPDAIKVAELIRNAIRNKELVKRSTNENLGRITMSIGVVIYQHGETIESLIHRADVCLYAAKGAGRNCVKNESDPELSNLSAVA